MTEVIAQGTKVKEPEESKVTVSEESKVESVGYETQYIEDPNMDSGTTTVKTPGQAGERTIVYEVTRDANGKELARVEKSDEITKVPVNEVVAKGTKLYAKPLVELASTDESVDNRVATVSYTVTDPNKKLQAIKVSLYKENEKITEKRKK